MALALDIFVSGSLLPHCFPLSLGKWRKPRLALLAPPHLCWAPWQGVHWGGGAEEEHTTGLIDPPGLPGSPWGGIVADRQVCSQARFHADGKSGMKSNPSKFTAH